MPPLLHCGTLVSSLTCSTSLASLGFLVASPATAVTTLAATYILNLLYDFRISKSLPGNAIFPLSSLPVSRSKYTSAPKSTSSSSPL